MNRPIATLFLTSLVGLAACTGDDTAGGVSGSDPVTVPPTTDAPPTEPDASTPVDTDPAETTTSSISTTSTTEPAPTTMLDPIAEIEAEIKQVRLSGQTAFEDAQADPSDQSIRDILSTFMTGGRLVQAEESLDRLVDENLAVQAGDPDISRIVFTGSIELPDGSESTEAFLEECFVNGHVLVTDTDVPVVVDDGVFSFTNRVRYVMDDGAWKHDSGTELGSVAGSDAC